jgi:uncharacterized protein (TIGR03437 family)
MPLVRPLQPYPEPADHTAFVAKLNATGTGFLFSSYLGGTGSESASALAVDPSGAAYIAGIRGSSDFPTTSMALAVNGSAFVSKIASEDFQLEYSIAFGGADTAIASIATDTQGDLVMAGYAGNRTGVLDFPLVPAIQQVYPVRLCNNQFDPCPLAFVSKLDQSGTNLIYSTLFGGSDYTVADHVRVDRLGNAFVSGRTHATDFPHTPGAYQPCNAASPWLNSMVTSVFLTEFSERGDLVYSTYIGGTWSIASYWLGVGIDGRAALSGSFSDDGTTPVFLHFPLDPTTSTGPSFARRCVVNAASRRKSQNDAQESVSAGEFLSIFGSGLGPQAGVLAQPDSTGTYSGFLAGTRVLFDGVPAPLLYAQDSQVNVVAPLGIAGHQSTLIQIEVQGRLSQAVEVAVIPSGRDTIAFFTSDHTGSGQVAAFNEDGTVNSPDNPAGKGSVVRLFVTGLALSAIDWDGQVSSAKSAASFPYLIAFGKSHTVGDILYVGDAPGFVAGVQEVDVRIPKDDLSIPTQLMLGGLYFRNLTAISVR